MKPVTQTYTLALVAFISLHLSSCMMSTSVQVVKPVDIDHEAIREVKRVLIVNRTGIKKEDKGTNVIEGIFTGETIQGDKRGAEECIRGVRTSIGQSLNYKGSEEVPVVFYGGATKKVPEPLPWGIVDSLCKQYNAEALVCLEYFDSDAGISMSVTNPSIPVGYSGRSNDVQVKTVWRMYKVTNKQMIDDFTNTGRSGTNRPRSPYIDQNRADRYQSVLVAGYWAGYDYGMRISEQWVTEGRRFWRTGNKSLRHAAKLARFSEWDNAYTVWQEQSHSMRPKVRARALHNMAIYHERKGELQQALDLVTQAFQIKHYHDSAMLMQSINQQLNNQSRLLMADK